MRIPRNALKLQEREAHVWQIPISVDLFPGRILSRWLVPFELSRARGYLRKEDTQRFMFTRAALRCLLARYVEISPDKIHLYVSPKGKPFTNLDIGFNVSHSGNIGIIGFSKGRIGVDVESVTNFPHIERVAKEFFSTREYEAVKDAPDNARLEMFFRCWTRKEAYLKAIGDGLFTSLSSFAVALGECNPRLEFSNEGNQELKRWKFFNVCVPPQYSGALVVERKVDTVVERILEPPQFFDILSVR